MADDDNVVVPGPSNGPKVKSAKQIASEIAGEALGTKAKEFKTKLKSKLDEVDKAYKAYLLLKAEADKMMADFDAENGQ